MQNRSVVSLAASVVASVGASVCCVVPLVFVMAGLGGSWLSTLRVLEPYRPVFMVVAIGALAIGYWQIFKAPAACAPGDQCAAPTVQRSRKIGFWIVSVVVLALLASPYVIAYLSES
jgi:mercuric ion transport protein